MSKQLRQNLQAIQIAVDGATRQAKDGRNRVIANYYAGISPGVRENLTFTHGTQVYRNKTLPQFFRLIDKRSIKLKIRFIGGDDNTVLARAANDISNMVYARAMTVRRTGTHLASLTMFAREVGFRRLALVNGALNPRLMPERTVISIVATTEYASTLEARGIVGGILYHVAKEARAKYRSQLAVKYDYVSGRDFGLGGGTFPRIQIAHYGNLRGGFVTPGRGGRSGRRRKGYAQAKGRSR